MKIVYSFFKYLVGVIFIVSGFVKVIDPIGTAIKLEEYFYVFSQDFTSFFLYFIPIALPLSVILCVLEGTVGLALILNYKIKFTLYILLSMIIFFLFLTFYSAYFNKVTDCGCFGDALKLSPWQTFSKDLILTIFIVFLFLFKPSKKVRYFSGKSKKSYLKFSLLFFGFLSNIILAYWGLAHLPIIDFRPYHIGANLPKSLKPSQEPIIEYEFERNGKIQKSKTYLSKDMGYIYKGYKILNKDKTISKISDFSVLSVDNKDFTKNILEGKKLIIVIQNVSKTRKKHFDKINKLIEVLPSDITPIVLTSDDFAFSQFRHEIQLATDYFLTDATVLKAMIRSNPGVLLFDNGIIKGKWHFNDIPETL